MKNKKMISLLCAATIAVSILTGVSVSADENGTSAAEIENTVTFDFETDATSISAEAVRKMTSTVISDSTGNGTKVLSVTGSSDSSSEGRFGLAYIDISQYTTGKSHIILDYDAYIANSGRMTYVITDEEPATYGEKGLFRQGRPKDAENAVTDVWIHTTVDVNVETGTGTYKVTNEKKIIVSGDIETSKQELTMLAFISWLPTTSYIDNIKIQTGGVFEKPDPTPVVTVSPETPSMAEGSGFDLMPENAVVMDNEWTEALGTPEKILNHSNAKPAKTTENTAITAYQSNVTIRGKSVYAVYDVCLTPNSQLALTPYGNSGASQASTLKLTANAEGVATVSAITSAGTTSATEKLVHNTWYRVLIDVPQGGDATVTTTGSITYTVYRINPNDPSQTSEVAAKLTGLSPRGLDKRALSSFGLSVTGDVYIDNAVVYVAVKEEKEIQYGELVTSYSDGVITVTDNTLDRIAETAVAIVVSSENSVLSSVSLYPLTFSGGKATAKADVGESDRIFIWNSMKNIKPLAEIYKISA